MTPPMRVLVTGSRDWPHPQFIYRALDKAYQTAATRGAPSVIVVHGCAKGADTVADSWARDRAGRGWSVSAERHPADWARHRKRAGFLRNKQMVDLGADLCLAFIHNHSRGATMCAALAESAGIHTQRFEIGE